MTQALRVVVLIHLAAGLASAQPAPATRVAASDHFDFHSDPWINLHHFLYQWAREDRGLEIGLRPVPMPERASLEALTAEERTGWMQALDFYRTFMAERGNFDLGMMRTKWDLLTLGGDPAGHPPDRIPGIGAALEAAMPVYRQRWWASHDRANRRWIEAVMPKLRRHEAAYVQLTMKVHESIWPSTPFRVDVTAYPNYRAGYTTREGHIVMFSTDPNNQDLYSLEMVLHEVQHAETIEATTPAALAAAFEAAGSRPPGNLSHAMIFATAGEFVRSIAGKESVAAYQPYWLKQGLDTRDDWKDLVAPIANYWLPVVRGELSRKEGLERLAGAKKAP